MNLDVEASFYSIMGEIESARIVVNLLEKSLATCNPEDIVEAVKHVRFKLDVAHNDVDVLREQLAEQQ